MIQEKKLTAEYILTELFGLCPHSKMDMFDNFCEDCNMHPKDEQIITEFILSFNKSKNHGICGGILAQKLIDFANQYGNLIFKQWHGICLEIPKDDVFATYYGKNSNSFLFNLCWLCEILYRRKVSEGVTKEELRRKLNG